MWRGTDSLKRGEHRKWQRGDLNGASHDIGDHKHSHSYLPSSTLIGGSAHIVWVFLVLEQMGLALQGEPDSL